MEIKFKAKHVISVRDEDWRALLKIPAITRKHCDMAAARASKRFGMYANSDMFESMVRGLLRKQYPTGYIDRDEPPAGVRVIPGSMLCTVIIDLPDQ